METTTFNNIGQEASFEIEQDMRIFSWVQGLEKIPNKDFVEQIAAQNPLLGMEVLNEEYRSSVEKTALNCIKHSLDDTKVSDWASLAIFISIIQYARNWERDGHSGFWEYICQQFGYRYSPRLYDILTTSIKVACRKYNRFFLVDSNGENSYYSTVLSHSLSPTKSIFALFEFLTKFYINNLDYSVLDGDPALCRMVRVLRDRCQGATIEEDEYIRGNVGGIQTGLRALIINRPGYMKHFLTKTLHKISTLLSDQELTGKEHIDFLLNQWFIEKYITSTMKRGTSSHKRTTEIAFSYGKIRVEYILDDVDEPAIRIPSIRLASRDNPVVTIRSEGQLVYQDTIGIYGNDYTATSEEIIIKLSDISKADFSGLEVEIAIGGKQVYTSGNSLIITTLLFKDKKLQTGKYVEEGNYTLFSPQSVKIEFQGNVERHRRSYSGQLFDVYFMGEASVFGDNRLLYCYRIQEGSIRLKLPDTRTEYLLQDIPFPVYNRNELSITAVGDFNSINIEAKTQIEEILQIIGIETNTYQFSLPDENGGYRVTLTDKNTDRVYDEVGFYIASSCSVRFDRNYYLDSAEDGNVTLDIDGQHYEKSIMGFTTKVKIPFNNGDIQIQIPRIKLTLDGKPLPTEAIWKGEVSPSSTIRVLCPETIAISITFANVPVKRSNIMGGFEYYLGNAVQAYDGNADKEIVNLLIADDNITMFSVVFRMMLTELPLFNLTGSTLTWLNNRSFIGEKNTKLVFEFKNKQGNPIRIMSRSGAKVLSEEFLSESARYSYGVFAQTETAFGTIETKIWTGTVVLGDRASAIFRGEILQINEVIEEGNHTSIKTVFAGDITYIGTENLEYTDLNGYYSHYTANLYFLTTNGIQYFTDLNPVDIYLVNEKSGILHISFNEGAGLFIDKRGEFEAELYRRTDPPPKLGMYFTIPDFFVYQHSKEIT